MDVDPKFKLCNNDEDRVKLTLNEVKEFLRVMGECSHGMKSPEESEKFRHSGNLLFSSISPNLEEVLQLYSKSILYAPSGSEHLPLAYANRSAVLFRAKYYEECLEDISRALETGYPDSLKPKLLIRRVTCNYALTGSVDFEADEGLIEARALIDKLPVNNRTRKMVEDTLNNLERITSVGRQVKKTYPKYLPEMKGRNPHLPGASDAIALRYSEEYGRHLVATQDINSGEVLLTERPYATVVADEWIYCICNHCGRRTWNGIPCDYCIHAMFCCAECKRAAWEEYHDVECKIHGFAKEIGSLNHRLMGLRITVKAIKEVQSVEALRQRVKELDSVKASDIDIPINPNAYETFYIMSDNPERQQLKKIWAFSFTAASLTYLLAVRTNLFGRRVTGSFQAVTTSDQFLFVAGLMSKNMRIASNRTFGWNMSRIWGHPKESPCVTLMPVFSFLNHRCYDFAYPLRFNEEMILVNRVPISKGDQVFISYGPDYQNTPRNVRQKCFDDGWQFECNCSACKDDWSASTLTSLKDQGLPTRIVKKLSDKLRKSEFPSVEETRDPIKMIPFQEKFYRLIDFIYPQVKKPCMEVKFLVNTVDDTYNELHSMVYPPFVVKS